MSGSSCVPWNIGAVRPLGTPKTCILGVFGATVNHHSIAASKILGSYLISKTAEDLQTLLLQTAKRK